MNILIKLILAHLLGDFVLQSRRMVIHKEARKAGSYYLYLHLAIHFALIMLLSWDLSFWKQALIITFSHGVIDLGKLYLHPRVSWKKTLFFLDQILHLSVLWAIAYQGEYLHTLTQWWTSLNWVYLTGLVFVTYPAAIMISKLMEDFSSQIPMDHKSLPNAGMYIGIIERLFVFMFIITNHWEGIGLLIAAKSVFRFNDLKESNNRKLTEYILIGTLLSFGMAIFAGLLTLAYGSGL